MQLTDTFVKSFLNRFPRAVWHTLLSFGSLQWVSGVTGDGARAAEDNFICRAGGGLDHGVVHVHQGRARDLWGTVWVVAYYYSCLRFFSSPVNILTEIMESLVTVFN